MYNWSTYRLFLIFSIYLKESNEVWSLIAQIIWYYFVLYGIKGIWEVQRKNKEKKKEGKKNWKNASNFRQRTFQFAVCEQTLF